MFNWQLGNSVGTMTLRGFQEVFIISFDESRSMSCMITEAHLRLQ